MTEMEIQLRGAMDDLAAEAPSPDGLLDTVHRRGRRAHRRRVVTGVAAVVALALVGGLSVLRLTGEDEAVERLRIATPGPTKSAGPLVEAPAAAPSPVDVGWLPKGFPEPTVRLVGPRAWALDTRREEGLAALQVQVMAAKPAVRTSPGELSPIDLDGLPGQLYWVPTHEAGDPAWGTSPPEAEGPYAELTFQRAPGQWIRIILQNSAGAVDLGVSKEDLARVATSLVDEERKLPSVLRVRAPYGALAWATLANDDYRVTAGFVPTGTRPTAISQEEQPNGHNGGVRTSLSVSVLPADSLEIDLYIPRPSQRSAGDKDIPDGATVTRLDGSTTVLTALRGNPKLAVVVRAEDKFGIPEAELRAMAQSAELGPDALVKPAR